jgi:hypothetical protein
MTLRSAASALALLFAPFFALTALVGPASAGHCPHCPKTTFCRPKAPCIKYKCLCSKPICCGPLEHFGYYPTCWTAWPFPPDYSHCPSPPTAVTAPCAPNGAPNPPPDQLPAPQPLPALE